MKTSPVGTASQELCPTAMGGKQTTCSWYSAFDTILLEIRTIHLHANFQSSYIKKTPKGTVRKTHSLSCVYLQNYLPKLVWSLTAPLSPSSGAMRQLDNIFCQVAANPHISAFTSEGPTALEFTPLPERSSPNQSSSQYPSSRKSEAGKEELFGGSKKQGLLSSAKVCLCFMSGAKVSNLLQTCRNQNKFNSQNREQPQCRCMQANPFFLRAPAAAENQLYK